MDTSAASPSASGSGAAQDGPAELDLEDPSGGIAHPAAGGGQTSSRDYATASNAPSTSHNTAIPSSSSTTHASGASRPTPSSLGVVVDASSNSNSGNRSAGRLGGFISSNKSSKLINAEAATAAALIGNLDSPSLSNVSPTTATSSSIDSASHINNNAISGLGGSSSNKNTTKAGEGTITNTAAVGPPTPSATRLPFLPSALKKGSSSFKTNPVPSSSAAPANAASPSLSSEPLITAGGNFLSSKKGKKAARANTIRNAFSSSSAAALKDVNQDDSGAGDTSISSTASQSVNAYEKSYNASAAKVHSKRDREEAREAREKERLYGSNLVLQHTSSNSKSNIERTKTPGGNSMTGGNTFLASSHSQETPSLGFASPHMSPALLEAGQANDRLTRQDSYMRSGISFQNNFNGEGDMSISKSRGLGGANNNRKNLTKEEEEDILAAQLGGGIGPTTSRIKKSTKKAPTSPNNVQGEKLAAEMEKEQDAYVNSKKKNATTAAVSGGGLAGSKKRVRASGNEEKDDIEAARGTATTINTAKKDTQLQFSPKVSKPFNISWRAIKRKFLLASTGTPSSGEGSRRSETSETSGGSRHRMYVQNPGTGGAAPHGEKQVHIQGVDDGLAEEDWEVDQVVVDNDWFDDEGNPILWGSAHSGSANGQHGAGGAHGNGHKDGHHGHGHHGHGEKVSNSGKETTTNHSETAGSLIINPTVKAIDGVVTFFRGYLIPKCAYFFEPRFGDPEKELNFRKERWYNTKRNAAFGCFFLILNWALLVSLIKMQGTYQKVLYYGLLTLFVWPMPFFVAFDLPRTWPTFYSFWGITATMLPAFFGVISMYVCHFLIEGSGACNGQTFLTIHYYATGFAVVALFALHINRLATVCSQLIYWILTCVMLLPEQGNYARTAINFLVFSVFIIFLHFQQEKIDRRMFTLRTQLKISYRALQKSQIAEKKASNSKKRFISYIFHEVRVPLNTAYLAFQNLQQSNGFNRQDEDQMVEVYALESSLQQVQQVLNDVLDLQRMDAGKFESSSQPFNFHRAINALVASLKVAATAKRLRLDVQLDERIDNLPQSMDINGQKASYVIGDEIRLRQVLTNIASNAVKFSREGRGGIKVRTKLIWPEASDGYANASDQLRISDGSEKPSEASAATSEWKDSDITPCHGPSDKDTPYTDSEITFNGAGQRSSREKERDIEKEAGLSKVDETLQIPSYPPSQHRAFLPRQESDDSDVLSPYASKRRKDFVIVRIEIEDNGPGIRPSDMVDQRLFSAYVQTEIGRVQGGKGSGLGLAIVRAIVQMTRGRLGVQSSKNGTTFWIEQRYHFATPQEVEALQALQDLPTPLSINADPLPRPVRPPMKPYKTGESSYSQYSASRLEAAMALDQVQSTTPTSETERPLMVAALGGLPLPGSPNTSGTAGNLSAESLRAGSASISSLPGSTGNVGTTSATNAIDIHSPLTSEQWTQNAGERALMPTMSVTAPTPPSATPMGALVPSPTRSTVSAKGAIPSVVHTGTDPAPGPIGRTFSDDAKSAMTSASSNAPAVASPVGEDAFTPMTRQVVTSPTPEGEGPPVAESSRVSPLPMPAPVRSRPSSQASVPSVAHSQGSASGTAAASGSSGQAERLTALVVDDDALTRKLMSRMMARLGCQVEDAENGQAFLDIVLGNEAEGKPPRHFDIVTLDNAMPVMTGEQAIKEFRKAGRTDLVVGATGNALKGDQTSYLKAGVDTVLTKPISARDLTAQLNLARKRRQAVDDHLRGDKEADESKASIQTVSQSVKSSREP